MSEAKPPYKLGTAGERPDGRAILPGADPQSPLRRRAEAERLKPKAKRQWGAVVALALLDELDEKIKEGSNE